MDELFGRGRFEALADRLLNASAADQTEVVVIGVDAALTRFANSGIHQNVAERNVQIRVRAIVGKRSGVATTNDVSEPALAQVLERAVEAAKRQPEDPDLPDLPGPLPVELVSSFSQATADCSPEQRAKMVRPICALAVEHGLKASGACSSETTEIGIANSRGVRRHELRSSSSLLTVILDDQGSGYAERTARDVESIDAEALGREAVDKAVRSRGAELIEPGEYPVVLESYAVGEMLMYLAYMGFGALALQEGTSFLRGRLGQQVVDRRISVWDDAHNPLGLPASFDFEGVPKQKVSLIENGVGSGVVYDTKTASREGGQSTGHALPAPDTFGPFPSHLMMGAGDTPRSELAKGIQRGLWVTRFNYVNVVKSDRAVLTGLTKDGTFLIENGEVTRPVKNLRFTQGVLEAWSGLQALGAERRLMEGWGGAVLAPDMRLDRFRFTGVSHV
ncbi:MAG TPA: TldD/PmbA family protein [Chloroflexota bacterium]|nr:TldD/PmbA family protein [Chloroflexota bacterium]